jgi:MFS family permease
MAGFAAYSALLAELRDLWKLSNTEAGLVGGLFFAGYIATVSYATALTDRLDPRKVYVVGCALCVCGCAGFGLFAGGFATAAFFQVLAGAGIGATYMPGLRLLSDLTSGPSQSRYVAFYTSFFVIGVSVSYALAGIVAPPFGWRAVFIASAIGPVVAGALVWFGIPPVARPAQQRAAFSLAQLFPFAAWKRVLLVPAAAGYTAGYSVHCLELLGSGAWIVAFLLFSSGLQAPGAGFPWSGAAIAAFVSILGVPASVLGNEAALRLGRRRWILGVMCTSALVGVAMAFSAAQPWFLVLALLMAYSLLVMADSAALTAGMVAAAPAELRGAAMGLYSLCGFGFGTLGPPLFGAVLDAGGGTGNASAWVWAYASIGAGCLVAPIAVRLVNRAQP